MALENTLGKAPTHAEAIKHDNHSHEESAHTGHADQDHAEHNHAEHDHADHADHDHTDHADHDHTDHADHDHAGHDHAGHDRADQAGHAGHDHSHELTFEGGGSFDLEAFMDGFIHLAVEFSLIFLAMSICMALALAYVPQRKIQSFFGASHGRGYAAACLFAAISPLCTFSTIPMLQGLLRAQVNFGPAMTFLLGSPLLSPLIVALMFTSFGLRFTLSYALLVVLFAMGAGFLLHRLQGQRYLKDAYAPKQAPEHASEHVSYSEIEQRPQHSVAHCGGHCCEHSHDGQQAYAPLRGASLRENVVLAIKEGFTNFKQAAPYLLMGIALGALVYSFAPQAFLIEHSKDNSLVSLFLASLLGLPLHVHVETIIPACKILLEKGVGLGVVMAFYVACGGSSITSLILLKSLFKLPLLVLVTVAVFIFALLMGLIFPFLLV